MNAHLDARYELFGGGRKLAELSRSRAALESAEADEVTARYDVALRTESDFYGVLADQELDRVAAERVRRAGEQLLVARARVVSGAAVATDSLQLLLELDRARVSLLRQQAALRVSRLQLGRRVGVDGGVEAAPVDTVPPPELPFTVDSAIMEARARGPRYVSARAAEQASGAVVKAARGSYFPDVIVSGSANSYDNRFFPNATSRSALTVQAVLPIWNNGQREVQLALARAQRDLAVAIRRDRERAAARDVTEAYEAFNTARATTVIATEALLVARENYRVQETRYRAGATTILDLVNAQVSLAEAESGLVQSRYDTRLARARLESILGRRIFDDGGGAPE